MKKKEKIYIVMANKINDNQNGNDGGKICCTIKKDMRSIVVSVGYNKTYLKDQFCESICDKKTQCCKKKWDDSCFINIPQEFNYNKFHITRHNTVLHYSDDNKSMGKLRWERPAISDFTNYEFIAGYTFSPTILFSNIAKDYSKSKENEVILLSSNDDNYFNVYVFVNPKNDIELFEDLKKYNFEIAIYEYEEYDIVIVVQIMKGTYQTPILGFTNKYISTHCNFGVSKFKPLL